MDFDELRSGFEEFQNGRQWCDDLHGRFPDDVLEGSKGWLYCGQLWIEDTSTWSEDVPGYGEGPDLRRMVEEYGPVAYRTATYCIAQAAEGLAHAHAAGFVHRDIRPANLLVDRNGIVKILGFGPGQFVSEGSQSAVGTADYAAPEQMLDSQNVDCHADIYGLGYTFYFLLTGRRPFPKTTVMEILTAHQVEKHEPVGKFRPDIPLELEAIIDKMTAKLPLQRYRTAKEVADRLRSWLNESDCDRG